jgi:hypothetical protein
VLRFPANKSHLFLSLIFSILNVFLMHVLLSLEKDFVFPSKDLCLEVC